MAAFTPVDFIAAQLRESAPDADWNAAGVDRARELAAIFVRNGVRDLGKLKLEGVTITKTPAADWLPPVVSYSVGFDYEGKKFGYMGTPDRADVTKFIEGHNRIAWSAAGHGNVEYVISRRGNGIVFVPQWGSSSDWGDLHAFVKFAAPFILLVALPIAGVAVGAALGAAIIGPAYAAAYPGLAAAIGNFALAAAMSGGNVEQAAKMAVLGYVGGVAGAAVGSFAAESTNLQLVGKLAGSATATFVQGGDVKQAVASTLLRNGGDVMDIFGSDSAGYVEPVDVTSDGGESYGFISDPTPVAPTYQPSQWAWGVQDQAGDPSPGTMYPGGGLPYADPVIDPTVDLPQIEYTIPALPSLDIPAVTVEPARPPMVDTGAGFGDVRSIINAVSSAATAALGLVASYRRTQAQINPQSRYVAADGTVISGLDNGTVQTRDPVTGLVTVTRPPVGVPQATIGGGLIVNNGDGTYTLISSSGTRRTIAYGENTGVDPGFSLSSLPWPLILAGAGLFITLARSR